LGRVGGFAAAGDAPYLGATRDHPVIRHRFKWKRASMAAAICYGSRGGGAALAFHHQLHAYNTETLIGALGELHRTLGGQKATLLWDGLPAHRRRAMRAWLARQRSWLVVERLPGYAPDLNPVEALWANLKGVELPNLAGDTLDDLVTAAERGIQRIRRTPHLAFSFLRTAACRCGEQRAYWSRPPASGRRGMPAWPGGLAEQGREPSE
jgi:hypothetical protein